MDNTFVTLDIPLPDIDLFIGLPFEENYRTTRGTIDNTIWSFVKPILTTYRSSRLAWGIVTGRTFFTGILRSCGNMCNAGIFNNPYIRAVEKPSSLGIGTARALAKVYNVLLHGDKGSQGRTLLSQDSVQSLYTNWEPKQDMVLGYPTRFNYGFGIYLNRGSIDISFGHAGSGGQMSLAHPAMNLTQAYLTKHRGFYAAGDDPRWFALSETLIKCVKKLQALRT